MKYLIMISILLPKGCLEGEASICLDTSCALIDSTDIVYIIAFIY